MQAVVAAEINYQRNLWSKHWEGAVENAGQVLAGLTDPAQQGYRALWNYLAGAAAAYGEASGVAGMKARARTHFAAARDAAGAIRWLAALARFRTELLPASAEDLALKGQVERLEATLLILGTKHEARFAAKEKSIIDGINSADSTQFEVAHKELGEMLGFEAGRLEADASPDPWWRAGKYCLVFEDHSEAQPTSSLGAEKARQANGHPAWMKAIAETTHVPTDVEILSVLVSPVKRAEKGSLSHLTQVACWPLDEFRKWGRETLNVVRELRRTMGDDPDLAWRAETQAKFEEKGYDAATLMRILKDMNAEKFFKRK